MLNRLGGSVAQFADKTRSFAVEALVALDAPEQDSDHKPIVSQDVDDFIPKKILAKLLESLTNNVCRQSEDMIDSNLEHQATVIVTQIDLIREEAYRSNLLSHSQKQLALSGSFIEFVDSLLVSSPGDHDTAANVLLEALETEQRDRGKDRSKWEQEQETLRQEYMKLQDEKFQIESKQFLLQSDLKQTQIDLESSKVELYKIQSLLEKVVEEKNKMELDHEDIIDVKLIRSAFVSLCSQIDNKPIRNNIIQIISDILQLNENERTKARISHRQEHDGLANKFLQFLNQELIDDQNFEDNNDISGNMDPNSR